MMRLNEMTRAQLAVLWLQVRHLSPDAPVRLARAADVLAYPELTALPISVN